MKDNAFIDIEVDDFELTSVDGFSDSIKKSLSRRVRKDHEFIKGFAASVTNADSTAEVVKILDAVYDKSIQIQASNKLLALIDNLRTPNQNQTDVSGIEDIY